MTDDRGLSVTVALDCLRFCLILALRNALRQCRKGKERPRFAGGHPAVFMMWIYCTPTETEALVSALPETSRAGAVCSSLSVED